MKPLGYLLVLLSLYVLYQGTIIFGAILFFLGGFIAGKLFISLRSTGVLILVSSIAYGYHNAFSPTVFFIIFVGFVLACFNTRRSSQRSDDGWGIDIDFSSFGSSSDNDGGGDCGGGGD